MQPTQLQVQGGAMTVLAGLTREAFNAGATMAPHWCFPETSLVDGRLTSLDESAVRELHIWRGLVGAHRLRTYTYTSQPTGEQRRVWVIEAVVEDVSVWLRADIPATVEISPVDMPVLAAAAPMLVVAA